MVVIRLSRTGTNKRPFYHMVVADHRFSRDGRYLERVGFYNPIAKGPEIYLRINNERIGYWLSQGAQPSERVRDLMQEFARTGERTGAEFATQTTRRDVKKAKAKAAKKAAKTEPAAAEAPATSETQE